MLASSLEVGKNAEKKKKKRKRKKVTGDAQLQGKTKMVELMGGKGHIDLHKNVQKYAKPQEDDGMSDRNGVGKTLSNWEKLKGTLKSSKRKRPAADCMQINISMDDVPPKEIRGQLTKVLALDCEMVGGGVGGQLSLLARVSIVNSSGDVVYDTFVSPTERITDYRTQWSGIRPNDLVGAPAKQNVVERVQSILSGRIILGHALQNDLEALNISHPESHLRDSSRYPQFMRQLVCGKLKPRALRHIVADELDMVIQTGEHDSIQDARAVLGLYQKHKASWEVWHSKEMKRLKKQRRKQDK